MGGNGPGGFGLEILCKKTIVKGQKDFLRKETGF